MSSEIFIYVLLGFVCLFILYCIDCALSIGKCNIFEYFIYMSEPAPAFPHLQSPRITCLSMFIDKISNIFAFALAFYLKVWYNISVDRNDTKLKGIEK